MSAAAWLVLGALIGVCAGIFFIPAFAVLIVRLVT